MNAEEFLGRHGAILARELEFLREDEAHPAAPSRSHEISLQAPAALEEEAAARMEQFIRALEEWRDTGTPEMAALGDGLILVCGLIRDAQQNCNALALMRSPAWADQAWRLEHCIPEGQPLTGEQYRAIERAQEEAAEDYELVSEDMPALQALEDDLLQLLRPLRMTATYALPDSAQAQDGVSL